ncbi:MAG: hypothetical protein JW726_00485 [Anaerolineales bacterium]|nr:hypothetical protein [Anaerolineales bacterium]
MKSRKIIFLLCAISLVAGLTLSWLQASRASADGEETWTIDWWVSASGGHPQGLTARGYSISSTIGQMGYGASSGSGFTLDHGYWQFKHLSKMALPIIIKR